MDNKKFAAALRHWQNCFETGTCQDEYADEIAYVLADKAHDIEMDVLFDTLIDKWDEIASSLAPENLHEDGEISQAGADQKFMEIHKEAKALFQMMPCPQDIINRCDDDLSMYAQQKQRIEDRKNG